MKRQRKLAGSQGQPQAWIALHKNRQRTYSEEYDNTIYLKDKQEFQIELYNPTQFSVLVKIKINGSYISNRGLILEPAQRWFLDRYIDSDRKFAFGTYQVDNNESNKEAISNNGLVEVEFYNEIINTGTIWVNQPYWLNDWNKPYVCYSGGTTGNPNTFNCNTITLAGDIVGSTTTSNATYDSTQVLNSGHTTYTSGMDISEVGNSSATMDSFNFSDDTIETGRVKEGGKSSQGFEEGYGSFNSYTTKKVTIKLMPLSTKPIKKSEVRNYCVNCSARIRKTSWKFCPSCGEDLQCC